MAHWGREHHGEIKTLQDAARANRQVWCFGTNCGRSALTDPYTLAELAGGNFGLVDLGPHLECKHCKLVGFTVVIVSPHHGYSRR
jgi:tRNA-dihydrouridine synthase